MLKVGHTAYIFKLVISESWLTFRLLLSNFKSENINLNINDNLFRVKKKKQQQKKTTKKTKKKTLLTNAGIMYKIVLV